MQKLARGIEGLGEELIDPRRGVGTRNRERLGNNRGAKDAIIDLFT